MALIPVVLASRLTARRAAAAARARYSLSWLHSRVPCDLAAEGGHISLVACRCRLPLPVSRRPHGGTAPAGSYLHQAPAIMLPLGELFNGVSVGLRAQTERDTGVVPEGFHCFSDEK